MRTQERNFEASSQGWSVARRQRQEVPSPGLQSAESCSTVGPIARRLDWDVLGRKVKDPGITCQAPTAGSGVGYVPAWPGGPGTSLERGGQFSSLGLGYQRAPINAGGLIAMTGYMCSLADQRPFSFSGLHTVRALCPGRGSSADWQLLPGLGDRPLGTVPPEGKSRAWPHGGYDEVRARSPSGVIPEWGQRRQVPQVRASRHQPLLTQDKTQVLKQPWESNTSHNRSHPKHPHTTSEHCLSVLPTSVTFARSSLFGSSKQQQNHFKKKKSLITCR